MSALPSHRAFMAGEQPSQYVLNSLDHREAISTARAAEISDYSEAPIRRLVAAYDLGRRIGGRQGKVSRIAIRMFLDGNSEALAAHINDDHRNPAVRAYFGLYGIPEPVSVAVSA